MEFWSPLLYVVIFVFLELYIVKIAMEDQVTHIMFVPKE